LDQTGLATEVDLAPQSTDVCFDDVREGRVATRKMLLEQVWDFHFDPRKWEVLPKPLDSCGFRPRSSPGRSPNSKTSSAWRC
jgi:hypothetical protein